MVFATGERQVSTGKTGYINKAQLSAFVAFSCFRRCSFCPSYVLFCQGEKLWFNLAFFVFAFALPFLFKRLNVSNRLLGLDLLLLIGGCTFVSSESLSIEVLSSAGSHRFINLQTCRKSLF